jgi:hypothetical protein
MTTITIRKYIQLVLLSAYLLPLMATAHHSIFGRFDGQSLAELEGVVTAVSWRNPHITFQLSHTNQNGEEEIWDIESTSMSNLRRWQIEPGFIQVGDHVRIAGNPSVRGRNELFAVHVLIPSGEEVLIGASLEPRWTNDTLASRPQVLGNDADPNSSDMGIFRVWSHAGDMLFPETVTPNFDFSYYPLTPAARTVAENFNRLTDSPILGCEPKRMPIIMEQPYPMEIIAQDENTIVLHMEEYDTIRTIYLNSTMPTDLIANPLGNSSGRWEGNTLLVSTSGINWGHFDTIGIPASEQIKTTERFTLSEDGNRLDYRITVTDPLTFTQPVELEKFWLWYPEVTVQPYECLSE